MDVKEFLGLERHGDSNQWSLIVQERVCTPGDFLFGGCGLGAMIVALEETTGRPTIWATAQYLSYAPLGSTLNIDVNVTVVGGHITQARAVGRDQDREVLTVNASLGSNALEVGGIWVTPPSVPKPLDCPERPFPPHAQDSVFKHIETRIASGRTWDQIDGTPGGPDSAFWARFPQHLDPSAATLAIFADYLSGALAHPLGRHTMGRSLDNTIRMVQVQPTEWVLCDMRVHALVDGYAQGIVFLWSETGALLATASQSMAIKLWEFEA